MNNQTIKKSNNKKTNMDYKKLYEQTLAENKQLKEQLEEKEEEENFISEFEMDFGEELIEIIAKKLLDEGVDDSHRNIRLFLKDFMDWSNFLLNED